MQIATTVLFFTLAALGGLAIAQEASPDTAKWTLIPTASGEYKLFKKESLGTGSRDWTSAKGVCSSMGGTLAVFANFTAADWAALAAIPEPTPAPPSYFIGLSQASNRSNQGQGWYWEDTVSRGAATGTPYNEFPLGSGSACGALHAAVTSSGARSYSLGQMKCSLTANDPSVGVVCQNIAVYTSSDRTVTHAVQGAGWYDASAGNFSAKEWSRCKSGFVSGFALKVASLERASIVALRARPSAKCSLPNADDARGRQA
jgi:hypothetical protein